MGRGFAARERRRKSDRKMAVPSRESCPCHSTPCMESLPSVSVGVQKGCRNFGFSISQIYFWRDPNPFYESVIHFQESVIHFQESAIHFQKFDFFLLIMDYGFLIMDNGLLRVRNPFSRVRNPRLQREAPLSSFAKRCRSLYSFLAKMTSIPYLCLAKLPVQIFLHETHLVRYL